MGVVASEGEIWTDIRKKQQIFLSENTNLWFQILPFSLYLRFEYYYLRFRIPQICALKNKHENTNTERQMSQNTDYLKKR